MAFVLATREGLFDGPLDAAATRAFLEAPENRMAVGLAGGEIVSFASGTRMLHPDKRPIFFVNEVGTRDEWQRQGIATRVTACLLAEARTMGCYGIWLATEADNKAARALYRKLGARETGGVVVYDWDGVMDG